MSPAVGWHILIATRRTPGITESVIHRGGGRGETPVRDLKKAAIRLFAQLVFFFFPSLPPSLPPLALIPRRKYYFARSSPLAADGINCWPVNWYFNKMHRYKYTWVITLVCTRDPMLHSWAVHFSEIKCTCILYCMQIFPFYADFNNFLLFTLALCRRIFAARSLTRALRARVQFS